MVVKIQLMWDSGLSLRIRHICRKQIIWKEHSVVTLGRQKFLNVNEKVAVTKPATLELVDEIHNQSALTDLSEDMTTLIT